MKTTNVLSTIVVTATTAVVATVAVAALSCSLISGWRNGSYNPLNVGLSREALASKNSMSTPTATQNAATIVEEPKKDGEGEPAAVVEEPKAEKPADTATPANQQ